jgi:ABC-type polysaccharide transport system permease subunit
MRSMSYKWKVDEYFSPELPSFCVGGLYLLFPRNVSYDIFLNSLLQVAQTSFQQSQFVPVFFRCVIIATFVACLLLRVTLLLF